MKDKFTTIELLIENRIATVWLNRPEIHNAFNQTMIIELIDCFEQIENNESIRAVKIQGRGKSFCAGADLHWMKDVAKFSYTENYEESFQLSRCFFSIYTCSKPTIAIVHGAAIGGANGFLAACDFAFCEDGTVFSLSEVKIGIVPACISPYIIKRTGEFDAKELMLTGKRFKGKEAQSVKLVNKSFAENELQKHVESTIELLKTSGPEAMSHCKDLIYNVVNLLSLEEALKYTAKMIADIRVSEEGQEGMDAYLNKRKPNWIE